MASNSFKIWPEHNSALMDLVKFFEKARGREGKITLPKHLLDAVKDNEPRELETYALIQAIEPAESAVCNRIDAEGLVVLCRALLSAPSCDAQRRGLYLIMESLYHNQSDSPDKAALKRSKKLVIGKHALNALIRSFTDLQTSEQTQRWVGILALELLEGCPDNAKKLQSEPARLRSLTGVFKHSNSRVVTLITGSIVRILLNNGINPTELCLSEGDRTLYSKFPRSKDHDMAWVLAFEDFVDELIRANILTKQTSDVLYAFGLDSDELQYNSVDQSAIIVTVNRDLTIIVSASPTGPAIYVDVPIKNIINTQITSVWNDESQTPRYAVTIELSQIDGTSWYHNAVGQGSSTMSIAFTSHSHAEVLNEICRQSDKACLNDPAPVLESQPIDCSEPSTAAELHEQMQQLASSVSSAIGAIDVSQRAKTNCGNTDLGIQKKSVHTDGPPIEALRTVATSADPEFKVPPRHGNEDCIRQGQPSESEEQGYDSSYDISPRPSRAQSKIMDDALPVIQLDPLRPPTEDRMLPATRNGSLERLFSPKLSRSLRNNIGNVEAKVESPPSLRLERAAENSMEKVTTSRPRVNREVTALANSNVKFKKSQSAKQAKEGKGEGQAPKGEVRKAVDDEYDLPRSPEPQVRKSKASMMQDESTPQAPDRDTSPKQITKAKKVAKGPLRRPKESKSKKAGPQPKNVASQASGVHKIKAKPVANPTKTRPRRAAALIANKKIQGLEAFEEIGDAVDRSASKSRRQRVTTGETSEIQPSLTGIPEEKILRNTDGGEASVGGDAKNGMVSRRDIVPSSRPDEDPISEASSIENVELVTTTTGHGKMQAGTKSKSSPPAPNSDPFQAKLSLLTPENEATTSNAKESAGSRTQQKSKASKGYVGGQHQADKGETVGSAEQVNDRQRVIQPKPRDDVRNIQHETNSSLNSKSDLNKGRQLLPRPQQAISEPTGPRLPVPAVENKRKAVHDSGARATRRKVAPSMNSQSTWISANGSPMPSAPALNQRVQGGRDAQGATREYRAILPRDPTPRPPRWRVEGLERSRSIPAHYISHDGTLVNVHTEENIVPEEPQDPFISGGQAGTSDFMHALRRESCREARRADASHSESNPGRNAETGLPPRNEDPDETLVEGQPPTTQKDDDAAISISSTTTSSSSESASSGGVPTSIDPSSEEGIANIMAQWRKALQPHQRLMASKLSDISQLLIQRLAHHEKEVETLVENYRSGGTEILNIFMRERQEALEWNEAQLQQIRRQLSAALENTLADALDTLNEVGDERHEFMKRFNAHQGEAMGNAEQALLRFTEEG